MSRIQLWDIRDGTCRQTFTGHESDINTISVSQSITDLLGLPLSDVRQNKHAFMK